MSKRKQRYRVGMAISSSGIVSWWTIHGPRGEVATCSHLYDADRIAACLNACVGIRNPATWRKRADKAMKALEEP